MTISRAVLARVSKATLHRDIKRRYKAHKRAAKIRGKSTRSPIANLRLFELEKIFCDRFGRFFPNDREGRDALQVIAEAYCLAGGDDVSRLAGFIRAKAPWAAREVGAISGAAMLSNRSQKADEMAWRIGLSVADRDRLKIRTIGAVGLTARQRKAIQKKKRRDRQEERRRLAGAEPRGQYEAKSSECLRPWEQEGISRRTWYRRKKHPKWHKSVPHIYNNITGHAPVPTEAFRCSAAADAFGVRSKNFSVGEARAETPESPVGEILDITGGEAA